MKIPIEVTARHIHINRADLETLFGYGYQLNKLRNLSQSKFFACQETLDIESVKGTIPNVRLVGPDRSYTQVEISTTDAYKLGIKPKIRNSGSLVGTPGILLIGPKNSLKLEKGVIIAHRHIHLNKEEAAKLSLKDGQKVKVEIQNGIRSLIFKNVLIRVHKDFKLAMHVDTDEGNAAGLDRFGYGKIINNQY